MSSLVTGLITADLTDLIRIGLVTLSNKLSPPMTSSIIRPISDDKLLARLNEIWLFFFTGVLPHLEGVFWVLRSDDRLRAAVGESEAGRTTGSDGSGTPYGAQGFADTRIDVRRIALIEFRDCIVHPEMDRLVQIFASFYPPPTTATSSNGRPTEGFESRTSTRPPSVSQNYSDANDSSHPSLPRNPFRRSRSPPPHSAAFPPADRPGPSQRHQSSPARLSPNPEYIPSFEPRSPGMRSASGGSQFRPPRRTASHSSTSGFPRPFENPTLGGGSDGSTIGREDGMLAQTPAEAQALARRRQMIAILASLLTADDRQAEMDELVRLLRPVYNARYRRARGAPPDEEEDQSRDHDRGGGSGHYQEEDSGARTYGERDARRRSGTATPPPAVGADLSGALTSLTASPVMLSQERDDPVPDLNSHLAPFPVQPPQNGRFGVATLVDGTSSQISARQRSRTMNSLDEEQPDDHHYKVASRSPRLSDVQAHDDAQDSRPQRHSIDVPSAAAGVPARIPSSTSLRSGKKTRRLSFRPWLGRSNSAASSSAASIDGGGASSLAAGTEDGTGDSGAASLTPGTVEGDRLRRGLLRRNSSRRTSDLSSMVPQLGVGYGQLAEDPAADEEADWRERQS